MVDADMASLAETTCVVLETVLSKPPYHMHRAFRFHGIDETAASIAQVDNILGPEVADHLIGSATGIEHKTMIGGQPRNIDGVIVTAAVHRDRIEVQAGR